MNLFKVMVGKYPLYFQSKSDAKHHRDMLPSNTSGNYTDRIVMRGPDHWRGESFNKTTRMRGARSSW